MKQIPIGVQLFAVRGECKKGLPQTLQSLAKIGYVAAEPWGYGGDTLEWMTHPVADIRKMYDDAGLSCCGIHLHTKALLGDNLKRTIEFNRVLGNRMLIIAMDKERMTHSAGIRDLASILNDTAAKVASRGMLVGYHAHGFDFAKVDGQIAWDTLFSLTKPEVIMQLDIGNCADGGGDPIATLRKFPNRARSVHIKDRGVPNIAIGEGAIDWPTVLQLCDTQQYTEWYVIEQGGPDGLGYDIPQRSLDALKRFLTK